MHNPKITALIPAAGSGSRLSLGPKAWLMINERPLLVWVVQKLLRVVDKVIVAVSEQDCERATEVLAHYALTAQVIAGGATRQATVAKLVASATTEFVLIHDVARPLVSGKLLTEVIEMAYLTGGAAAFVAPEVPVAKITDGWVVDYFNAEDVGIFQAPQAFSRLQLLKAIESAESEGHSRQSTAQLWLDANFALHAVPGEKTNFKLTTQEDWLIMQALQGLL